MKEINIGKRKIGQGWPPFIIAEMSGNHNRSLEKALSIVEAAAVVGVDAIKLQTYTADTMTIDLDKNEFYIADKNSSWQGKTLYDLYKEAHTPWEWHKKIFDRCRELGIIAFSTPFDATAVDFLEKLNVPCYKIASFEIVDIPLIKKVTQTGKPLILSTGMATETEIGEAVKAARDAGGKDIILLKCTSSYPASPSSSNILTIPDLEQRFDCPAGLSDHTLGIGVAVASVVLGACVIEKHFTLSRSEGGVDAAFSLEPKEMKSLVEECRCAWQALGKVSYELTKEEQGSLVFRRSIYAVKDIKAQEPFTAENIRSIRPGLGLPPKHYPDLLGRKAKRAISKGTPLNWEMMDQ